VSGGSALYVGTVRHRRSEPAAHEFRYRTYQVLLDLDDVEALARRIPWLGYNGPGLTSFHDTDHLGPRRARVREKLAGWLAGRGVDPDDGRVLLLTNLRVLGHVFNPVSYYYCLRPDGSLRRVVAEVNNTFGDTLCYLLDDLRPRGRLFTASSRKRLHVSPFIGMEEIAYEWTLSSPDRRLTVHIDETREGRKFFDATLQMERRPLTASSLARIMLRHPLTPLHTVARIHWQALALWWKGVPVHRRPSPPENGLPQA
jgi:DUF1365 family protein